MNYKNLLILILLSVVIVSCSDDNGGNPKSDIDKTTLLTNYADNFIIPAYDTLHQKITTLESTLNELKNSYNQLTLNMLRTNFTELCVAWQKCSQYEFGPAEDVLLRQSINTFPTDTVLIEKFILSGEYTLTTSSSFKAKGLPALDYLLFNTTESNEQEYFTNDDRLAYMTAIVKDLQDNITYVHDGWDEYKSEFVSKTGNDVGSSLSQMINQFVFDYEVAKRAKVGFPLGIYSSNVLPYNFESPYSLNSNLLLIENMKAYISFVIGGGDLDNSKTDNLKEYLDELSATRGEQLLSSAILTEFNDILSQLNGLDVPMRKGITIDTEKEKIAKLYETMQKTVVLLKNDMTSAMGIKISYQDNDGD